MLVITPNSAYQICAIFNENQCVNSCPSSIYYNIDDKNICTDSYKCPNYKLIPNNICINTCDKNIFYSNESENERHCGLCKDYDFNKIYKMVNYEDCLETKINYTYYINEELKLISCLDKYTYKNGQCEFDCYETCNNCSEKSDDIDDQKCFSCKNDFYLYKNNCLAQCPNKTYQENNQCKDCDSSCLACNKDGCTKCFEGYYLDNKSNTCELCYTKCETCYEHGDDQNNNCIKCKNENEVIDNGNCVEAWEKKYKTEKNYCEPCKDECASCENGYSCTTCKDGYYNHTNECSLCYEKCVKCAEGGNETDNNCSSCKDDFYLVIEGEYANNCVEECPKDTMKDEVAKICNVKKPNNNNPDENKILDIIMWIVIIVTGFLILLLNVIFFCKYSHNKEEETNIMVDIQTEFSNSNFLID